MFKEFLKQHFLSQVQIAGVLNIKQQAVSKWCRGLCEPSLNAIIKMSETFNIPIEEIVLSFKKETDNGEDKSH